MPPFVAVLDIVAELVVFEMTGLDLVPGLDPLVVSSRFATSRLMVS